MIRRGRKEGWLSSPISTFQTWSEFNGVTFDCVAVGSIPDRGSGIVASQPLKDHDQNVLMAVPRELVLSLEGVQLLAKSDQYLSELLVSLGDFARTTRGAILIFLLHQASIANPMIVDNIGVKNQLSEYIKFLPEELLPTFWNEQERELLIGTSLKPALEAKIKSLQREFDNVRAATEHLPWCLKYWWDIETGLLSFDDWLQVDAMYRSRALEFPGIGDAMIPCIDMANHASGEQTAALYETDDGGNAVLLLRDGHVLELGKEVTITYGDNKGACEMIFSYGFLEESMNSAKEIFLGLHVLEDDPLGMAKVRVSDSAPGVKLTETPTGLEWHSEFIWLICVNEEDGLDFRVLQTIDGERELKTFWNDEELTATSNLRGLLQKHPLWDVYQLRAVTLIQQRIEDQIEQISTIPGEPLGSETADVEGDEVRNGPRNLMLRLRILEERLLQKAWGGLEEEKTQLIATDVVQKYLSAAQEEDASEEDFT